MKKLLLTLMALAATMSIDAQIVKVIKGEKMLGVFRASQIEKIIFEEDALPYGQGYADAKDVGYVKWVQLWEGGPKFAEYNVGVTDYKATSYGGYYTWGGTYKNEPDKKFIDDFNRTDDSKNLSGTDDTVTNLWGENWRMPTKEEFEALVNDENCTCTWVTQNGVNGMLFTGKKGTAFESNSVFFPAAGILYDISYEKKGHIGYYWSSTPYGSDGANLLIVELDQKYLNEWARNSALSVRAVLKEKR